MIPKHLAADICSAMGNDNFLLETLDFVETTKVSGMHYVIVCSNMFTSNYLAQTLLKLGLYVVNVNHYKSPDPFHTIKTALGNENAAKSFIRANSPMLWEFPLDTALKLFCDGTFDVIVGGPMLLTGWKNPHTNVGISSTFALTESQAIQFRGRNNRDFEISLKEQIPIY